MSVLGDGARSWDLATATGQNQLKMLAARKEFPACLQNFREVLEKAAEIEISTVSQRHADQLLESSVSLACVIISEPFGFKRDRPRLNFNEGNDHQHCLDEQKVALRDFSGINEPVELMRLREGRQR